MGHRLIQAIKLKEGVKIGEKSVDHLCPSASPRIFLNHLRIILFSHIYFVVSLLIENILHCIPTHMCENVMQLQFVLLEQTFYAHVHFHCVIILQISRTRAMHEYISIVCTTKTAMLI